MYCQPVGQVIFANWLATTSAMSGKSPIHSSRRLVPGSVQLALALGSLIRSQLYGLQPHDPFTFVSAGLLLAVTAGMAGLIPSWRASRVDPMHALRHD